MMRQHDQPQELFSGLFRFFLAASLWATLLTGLGHLPFAVRYGLVHWDNQISLWHYYAATALLLCCTYAAIIWFFQGRENLRLTRGGLVRTVLLGALIVSGLGLVLHNRPEVVLWGSIYGGIKLGHLCSALVLTPVLVVQFFLRLAGRSPCCVARVPSAAAEEKRQSTMPDPL